MTSVTDQTRGAVWITLCDLEYNRRYYTALADHYRSRHRMLRFGILASVPVEGAILYAATDYSWLFIPAIIVGIVLAALTVWDAISNYAEDAAVPAAHSVHLRRSEAGHRRTLAQGRKRHGGHFRSGSDQPVHRRPLGSCYPEGAAWNSQQAERLDLV